MEVACPALSTNTSWSRVALAAELSLWIIITTSREPRELLKVSHFAAIAKDKQRCHWRQLLSPGVPAKANRKHPVSEVDWSGCAYTGLLQHQCCCRDCSRDVVVLCNPLVAQMWPAPLGASSRCSVRGMAGPLFAKMCHLVIHRLLSHAYSQPMQVFPVDSWTLRRISA